MSITFGQMLRICFYPFRLALRILAIVSFPFRFVFGLALTVLKWPVILTLPLTILPLIDGVLFGGIFAFWKSSHLDNTADKYLRSVKYKLTDWGAGGNAISFHDFKDSPASIGNSFGVLRINSYDWTRKLGFILPDEYVASSAIDDVPIDKAADLETLMRNTNDYKAMAKQTESWVYLAGYGWPSFSPWDDAFKYAVRYAQGDRKLNQTSMYFGECEKQAGFLCGVWNTRTPALIHFVVDDEAVDPDTIEEGLTYSAATSALRRVTARIIQFPLTDAYTGLPHDTFPGYEEQMLAIMTGDRLYEQFYPYDPGHQLMVHFYEYANDLVKRGGPISWPWKGIEWMEIKVYKPLHIKETILLFYEVLMVFTAAFVQLAVLLPYKLLSELVGVFFAAPSNADRILGPVVGQQQRQEDDRWSFENLFADLAKHADAASSRSVRGYSTPPASQEPARATGKAWI